MTLGARRNGPTLSSLGQDGAIEVRHLRSDPSLSLTKGTPLGKLINPVEPRFHICKVGMIMPKLKGFL